MASSVRLEIEPQEWSDRAACKGQEQDAWYPSQESSGITGGPTAYAIARLFCGACPVSDECLSWAIEHNERFGMWGGRTPSERQTLARSHKRKGTTMNMRRVARAQEAKRMYDTGMSQGEIALVMDVTRETVSRYVRDLPADGTVD